MNKEEIKNFFINLVKSKVEKLPTVFWEYPRNCFRREYLLECSLNGFKTIQSFLSKEEGDRIKKTIEKVSSASPYPGRKALEEYIDAQRQESVSPLGRYFFGYLMYVWAREIPSPDSRKIYGKSDIEKIDLDRYGGQEYYIENFLTPPGVEENYEILLEYGFSKIKGKDLYQGYYEHSSEEEEQTFYLKGGLAVNNHYLYGFSHWTGLAGSAHKGTYPLYWVLNKDTEEKSLPEEVAAWIQRKKAREAKEDSTAVEDVELHEWSWGGMDVLFGG